PAVGAHLFGHVPYRKGRRGEGRLAWHAGELGRPAGTWLHIWCHRRPSMMLMAPCSGLDPPRLVARCVTSWAPNIAGALMSPNDTGLGNGADAILARSARNFIARRSKRAMPAKRSSFFGSAGSGSGASLITVPRGRTFNYSS